LNGRLSTPQRYLYARVGLGVGAALLVALAWWSYTSGPWWLFLLSACALPLVVSCAVFLRPPRRTRRRR